MTFTVVYGEFPQTRNYFWSLKIHAKGCGNIKNDVRKYGYREAKQHTWDYNTIREIAVDYWADHIRESLDYYDTEEEAIQSYVKETMGATCPCARKLLKDKSLELKEASS
tara:strand:- start:75 stop:404 length:330 start_codon:yes stop_codon:yes gene_type:complete